MFSSSCSIRNDFQSGEFQQAWSHDGTDNAVTWAGHPLLADQPFTLMFWFTGSVNFHITGIRNNLSNKYFGFGTGIEGSSVTIEFNLGSSSKFVSRKSSYLTQWAHICVSADRSNNMIGYYNGEPVDTSAAGHENVVASTDLEAYTDTLNIFRAGRFFHSDTAYTAGEVGEFVIYDTNLNAAQVRACYNGREPYDHKNGAAAANLSYWQRCNPAMRRGQLSCPTGSRSGSTSIISRDFDSTKYASPLNFSDSDIVSASVGKNV